MVKTAVLKTRPGKDHPELAALHGHWTAEAAHAGIISERPLASVRAAAAKVGIEPHTPEGAVRGPSLAHTFAETLVESLAGTLAEGLAGPAGGDQQTLSDAERVLADVRAACVAGPDRG